MTSAGGIAAVHEQLGAIFNLQQSNISRGIPASWLKHASSPSRYNKTGFESYMDW